MAKNLVKPHLVLVHGAWHSSSCYDILLPYLKQYGYDVTTVDLVSSGAEPPVKTIQPDVDAIKDTTLRILDAGQDVVLVMHSYAGIPGSAAVQGLTNADRGGSSAVVALVFLAAFMLDEGAALRQGMDYEADCGSHFIEQGDYTRHGDPINCFYNDVDPKIAKQMAASLKHHSRPTFYAALPYAAWRHVPTTYLICNKDQAVLPEWQRAFVEHARQQGAVMDVFECEAGHSPFLSQPETTARVIRHAAGEAVQVPDRDIPAMLA